MQSKETSGTILVIGALGQIGSDLVVELRRRYGPDRVIAADIRPQPAHYQGQYLQLDALDLPAQLEVIRAHHITTIYNLAAILSARGEQDPLNAWRINMDGLLVTLEAMRITGINRLFWPSSIAVFGPGSPKLHTPQDSVMDPSTVYGISKLAGERWCAYYHEKYGVDVRSLRYPGLISYRAKPGGGTTDYAVDIFHHALRQDPYTCFLREDTLLPMMYMPDAIRATIDLMEADPASIRVRSSYNLAGMSFTPGEIFAEIRKLVPGLQTSFAPDFRQAIADSWPGSIDDSAARTDWGWEPSYDLAAMVADMLAQLEANQSFVVPAMGPGSSN